MYFFAILSIFWLFIHLLVSNNYCRISKGCVKRVVSVGSSYFPLLESFVDKWCSKNGEELKKNFVFSPTVNLTLHMCNNRFQARFFWYIGIRWALLLLQIVRFRALCRHMSERWWNFCKKSLAWYLGSRFHSMQFLWSQCKFEQHFMHWLFDFTFKSQQLLWALFSNANSSCLVPLAPVFYHPVKNLTFPWGV